MEEQIYHEPIILRQCIQFPLGSLLEAAGRQRSSLRSVHEVLFISVTYLCKFLRLSDGDRCFKDFLLARFSRLQYRSGISDTTLNLFRN